METHLSYSSKEGLKQISVHCNEQQKKVITTQEMPLKNLSEKGLGPEGFLGYLDIFFSSGS